MIFLFQFVTWSLDVCTVSFKYKQAYVLFHCSSSAQVIHVSVGTWISRVMNAAVCLKLSSNLKRNGIYHLLIANFSFRTKRHFQ